MKGKLFLLLFLISVGVLAKEVEITSLQVINVFDEQYKIVKTKLIDFIERDEKVAKCTSEYIKKQSNSYTKNVQDNLYDLMNNFDRIASKVYGKKQVPNTISYEDRIVALAKVQCEAYYALGVLK